MREAAELAGFFSAHALWCVSDGETLIPIYASLDEQGARQMQRLAHERLEDGVAAGKQKLATPEAGTSAHVLIFDGRIPWNDEKLDALIVEWHSCVGTVAKVMLAIPYTPATKGFLKRRRAFAVHKPKLLEISEQWRERTSEVFEPFFAGVAEHEKGSAVWNKHLDESK